MPVTTSRYISFEPRSVTLAEVEDEFFRENGFRVVKGLFNETEIHGLRQRADEIGQHLDEYNRRDQKACERAERKNRMTCDVDVPNPGAKEVENEPEVKLSEEHVRRGNHIYPVRKRAVDPKEKKRLQDLENNPYNASHVRLVQRLTDHDDLFRSYLTHPQLVDTITGFLGPNVKMWHDHIFSKPPLNDDGPYHGANRYHQDGFFYFSPLRAKQKCGNPEQHHKSLRSVTCWIALDEVREEHGCLRYIPLSAGYGQCDFDRVGEKITPEHLSQEVLTPLQPGDAVFHDHLTIHATGPNETRTMRRGWALHFTDAESRYGDFAYNPEVKKKEFIQTSDGTHFLNGGIHGNLKFRLVCGKEFEGGI